MTTTIDNRYEPDVVLTRHRRGAMVSGHVAAASTLVKMSTTLLNQGIYDLREVAHLLGNEPVDRIIRWTNSDSKGNPPIVAPQLGEAFSFVDLVSLEVVVKLRKRGISESHLRRGVPFLKDHFSFERPLAHDEVIRKLATSGNSFLVYLDGDWYDIGKGIQGTFRKVVEIDLKKIDFGDDGVASVWRPHDRVILNPRIQAGAPCIEGTRVLTATIAALLEEQSVKEIAAEYQLTPEDVQAANAFEQHLNSGYGLAA